MPRRTDAARRDAALLRMLEQDSKVSVTAPTGRIIQIATERAARGVPRA
jgi:hypothetical protein